MTFGRLSVVVIGGGPAGIAAAVAAADDGVSVMLVEREKSLGGKLNQSIHDGFGFIRYDNALTGPEYVFNEISVLEQTNVIVMLQTSVVSISRIGNGFQLTISNRHGISIVETNAIVLATGCRERTIFEMGICGVYPAGIFTTGTAQYMLNVMGQLPVKKCIMLGSNNLTLEMARSIALTGGTVLGVYEPGGSPVGYLDTVSRCLFEHDIHIHFYHTVTRVFGSERLQAVELARADKSGKPVRGSEKLVLCDSFLFSTGFLPLNDLARTLNVPVSDKTGGPICDQNRMTLVEGIYACGNALHVSDLADFTSESGEIAGRSAARHMVREERRLLEITTGNVFLTIVPQYLDCDTIYNNVLVHFNSANEMQNAVVSVMVNGFEVFRQQFETLRPTVTQKIEFPVSDSLTPESNVSIRIEQGAAPVETDTESTNDDSDNSDE